MQALLLYLLVLNVLLASYVQSSSDRKEFKSNTRHRYHGKDPSDLALETDAGIYKVKFSRNTTHYDEFLRILKTVGRIEIFSDKLGSIGVDKTRALLNCKESVTVVLRPCDEELRLVQAGIISDLDCQPLDELLGSNLDEETVEKAQELGLDCSSQSSCPMLVTQKVSRRYKCSYNYHTFKGARGLTFKHYSLKPDVRKAQMEEIFHEMNFSSFAESKDLGFYTEVELNNGGDPLMCTGKLFISLNITRSPIKDIDDLVDVLINDGSLISWKDVRCGRRSELMSGSMFFSATLNIDFTLIKKATFPYWTCRHLMSFGPSKSILDYVGSINQNRHSESDTSYNTTIDVEATSVLYKDLNFKLKQLFVKDQIDNSGREEMFLVTNLILADITGNWSKDHYSKRLRLYFEGELELTDFYDPDIGIFTRIPSMTYPKLKPAIDFNFDARRDPESYNFNLNIARNLLSSSKKSASLYVPSQRSIDELLNELISKEHGEYPAPSDTSSDRPIDRSEL